MALVDRIFDVLEYVAEHEPARVVDLCTDLGLPRPTVHRLLATLIARGYVQHDADGHVYRIGRVLASLSSRGGLTSKIVEMAEPALVRLRDITGETVNLGVVTGGRIVYAAALEGSRVPRMSVDVGQDVPPHAAAMGKAILAALPRERRAALLGPEPYPRYTAQTIGSLDVLVGELELTTTRGYAVDQEEVDLGAVCVAAAIVGPSGVPVAGLSVSGTTSRIDVAQQRELGKQIIEWCEHVSALLAPS
ncbi:MAG: IclR family transcriptional regulator [Actinomycetota bacterium]|nr:IclR family transcriptional regulator [Actinomycetota bacterium]